MSERVQAAIEARERVSRGEPEPRKASGKGKQLQGKESAAVSEGREAAEAVSEEVSGAEGES
jgi:hypothetical protein